MSRKTEPDLLDQATTQITGEALDPALAADAAERVWQRLARENAARPELSVDQPATSRTGAPAGAGAEQAPPTAPAAPPAATPAFASCADFQAAIPAFIAGRLSPAHALLLEDHTRHCVPCRRALREQRQGRRERGGAAAASSDLGWRAPAASRPESPASESGGGTGRGLAAQARERALRLGWRLGLAALLTAGVGLGIYWGVLRGLAGGGSMARVAAVAGRLYRVEGASSVPLPAGSPIGAGEQVVTAKASHATLRMSDGSLIEMNERSGLSLAPGLLGNTIALARGRIIVQAAKQRPRHLYVDAEDCRVSVTGTIFAVNRGTKGSRVSVIEGEVHVKQARGEDVLHPGDQVSTHPSVTAVPVGQEVAWSQDAQRYDRLLGQLSASARAIDEQIGSQPLRTSSRLLDLVPAGTSIYVALPNLSGRLSDAERLLEQQMTSNDDLRQWWQQTLGSPQNVAQLHDLVQRISDLGRDLGGEVVIAAGSAPSGGGHGEPVLLAEVTRESTFRATLEQEVGRLSQQQRSRVVLVGDPASAADATGSLLLWEGRGVFVASPSAEQLRAVVGNLSSASAFTTSDFHARIADAYADGAGWLFAANLQQLMGSEGHQASPGKLAETLGIFDLEHLIVNHREGDAASSQAGDTRAALTFARSRRGLASWLAAPAPMGSLEFFTPDANLVAAFVVKSPVALLDELLNASPEFAAELAKAEAEYGFDLRNDLAAPLGGEIALGLDGPLLPKPSWKLVAEVYDPVRLEQTLGRAVARINDARQAAGKAPATLSQEVDGGNTYYSLIAADPAVEIHWVYVDGYLVAAPSRALLDRALALRTAGTSLATSPTFRNLLGQDGQVNVSALFYQDGALFGQLAGLARTAAAGMGAHRQGGTTGPLALVPPSAKAQPAASLLYAYAEDQRILFGGRNQTGPLGSNLALLAGFGHLQRVMEHARNQAAAGTSQP